MKTTLLLSVSALCLLTACSTGKTTVTAVKPVNVVATGAPASVAGMKLVFSDHSTYRFPSGNSAIISKNIDPGYGNKVTYTRVDNNRATVTADEWECTATYNLIFTSATSGTATAKGCEEGDYWTKTGLTFRLMPL